MSVTKLDDLIASARLSGRIDLLMELRAWLDEKAKAAEEAGKQLRLKHSNPGTENGEDVQSCEVSQ